MFWLRLVRSLKLQSFCRPLFSPLPLANDSCETEIEVSFDSSKDTLISVSNIIYQKVLVFLRKDSIISQNKYCEWSANRSHVQGCGTTDSITLQRDGPGFEYHSI